MKRFNVVLFEILPLAAVAALLILIFGVLFSYGQQPFERRLVGEPDPIGDGQTYPVSLAKLGIVLPRIVGDTAVDRRLNDTRTVFYRLPQVFQQWVPAGKIEQRDAALGTTTYIERPAVWGILSTSVLPEFNANRDFPWESTFGLNIAHRNKLIPSVYDVVNFFSLPEDDEGRLIPIIVLDERPVKWLFPDGTMFGEILYVKKDGKSYVQEIRTRTKGQAQGTWYPRVYRPVKDRQEFTQLTGIAYEPSSKFMQFRNSEEQKVEEVSGIVERLPRLTADTTIRLLSRPFQDVTESGWSPSPDKSEFSILPEEYSFGLLKEITAEVCSRCHRQTQISVKRLIPNEPIIRDANNASKIGNIRGSDGIFTWHPFVTKSIGTDVGVPPGRTIWLRRFDAENGLVRVIPKGTTPQHKYLLTRYVQASLAGYELPDSQYLHKGVPRKCDCTDMKCDCGDKCTCDHPKAWRPYVDDRRIAVDDNPQALPAKLAPKLVWVSSESNDGKLFLRDLTKNSYIGLYDPRTRIFNVLRFDGKDYNIGQQEPVPIPLPKGVK